MPPERYDQSSLETPVAPPPPDSSPYGRSYSPVDQQPRLARKDALRLWWQAHTPFGFNRRALFITLLALLVVGSVLVGGLVLFEQSAQRHDDTGVSSFATQTVETGKLQGYDKLLDGANTLRVNGRLQVSQSVALVPTSEPSNPVVGQLYVKTGDGQLYYYDGHQNINLSGIASVDDRLRSLQLQLSRLTSGQNGSGDISPVLTVQGQSGHVSFSAGDGIRISGTTIANNGVINLVTGSPNVHLTDDGHGTFTISVDLNGSSIEGSGTKGKFAVFDGANSLTNSILSQDDAGTTVTVSGTLAATALQGDGSLLTNLNADSINAGVLNDNRLSGNVALLNRLTDFTGQLQQNGYNVCTTAGNCGGGGGGPAGVSSINSLFGDLTLQGTTGQVNFTSSGTTITAALDPGVTLQGNIFNGANQLVQLNALGYLPALNGSLLTGVDAASLNGKTGSFYTDATNIASGILNDARLSSNTALYDRATSNFTGSLQQNGSDVCTVTGNCAGIGGVGDITGSGSSGRLSMFNAAKQLTNSWLLQNSSTLQLDAGHNLALLGGDLSVTGGGLFSGTVSGSDATQANEFVTLSQLAAATGGGGSTGVTSLNSLLGDLTLQGTTGQISFASSGTSITAVLDPGVTLQGNAFNGANQLVQLNALGYLPALNGSLLTGVNAALLNGQGGGYYTDATNISAGTLNDVRLSSNAALYDNTVSNFTGSLRQNGSDVCTVAGNCSTAGAAGGDLSGSYPNPTVARIQGTALNISGPTSGQLLLWNGAGWTNTTVSGDIAISSAGVATIQANSVALGTDTTGNYIADLLGGTDLTVTGTAGEGWTPTVTLGGNVARYNSATSNFTGGLQQNGNDVCTAIGNCGYMGSGSGAGVASLNSLAGDLTLQGTTGQISFASGSGLITASLDPSVSLLGQTIENSELANSSISVNVGTNLTGGGSVVLGSSVNVGLGSNVAILNQAANFTGAYLQLNGQNVCTTANNCGYSGAGIGAGVASVNALTGDLTLQGNSQIGVQSLSSTVSLQINADSVGDGQLVYKTGQNLTTVSTPSFAGLTLTGALTVTTASNSAFTGTVSGANAVSNNQFVTLAQLNTATGSSVVNSGTTNYLTKTDGSGNLINSQLYDDGTNVGIGTTAPTAKLQVAGTALVETDDSAALSVQTAAGDALLRADTATMRLTVGSGTVADTVTLTPQVTGTGTFQAKVDYATGAGSQSVATADFNGDGRQDIAVANYTAGTASVLLATGAGTFQPKVDYTTGGNPYSITTADFNGDGRPDLATANSSTNSVSVLLGNGDGTFKSKVDYTTGGYPESVATADFNGDGRLDLVIANSNSPYSVSILLGNGDGTFQPKVDYPTGANPGFVITADFNGDGKQDLAVANSNSASVSILLGNGDGTFQPKVDYPTGTIPLSITVADFNGDGKLDLATANNSTSASVSILLGNGDGTFQPKVDYAVGNARSITTADFNGDGKLDLAVTNFVSSVVSILLGNGNGTFQPKVDYATGTAPYSIATTDFNGDGVFDLATANVTGNSVSILLNIPATIRGETTTVVAKPAALQVVAGSGQGGLLIQGAAGATTGNLLQTQDSGGNVVMALSAQGRLSIGNSPVYTISPAISASMWLTPPVSYATGSGSKPYSVITADFNGDGKLDLAAANSGVATVSILLGNGDGTFQPKVDYVTGSNPIFVTTADFNGDGKLDLAVANSNSSSTVSILLGNGDGTFKPKVDYITGGYTQSVTTADFNGDGKLDLAAASANPASVSILLGNGDGTFKPKVDYTPIAGESRYITAADFNGDGKQDLVVANGSAATVSVLLGNGDGTFKPKVDYTASSNNQVYFVTTADFNGDGKLDLVTASPYTSSAGPASAISVLLGNGDGTFQPRIDYTTGSRPYSVAIADFNGDSKPDLAVSNNGASAISILLGNGDGTFQPKVDYTYTTGAQSASIITADFNGDGRPDLVLANSGSDSISILFGGRELAAVSTASTAALSVTAANPADGGLFIKSAVGQTADLLGIQDATGATMLSVNRRGTLTVNATVAPAAILNRSNDGIVVDLRSNGTTQGTISISGATTSYNAFTGSHYAMLEGGTIARGELASLTGDTTKQSDTSETIYGIQKSTIANDPNILGSYLSLLSPDKAPSTYDNPQLVMAAGNGDVWVADNGTGNVTIGDPLISSGDVAGYAQRDPQTFAVSHIFAKAAEAIDWSSVTVTAPNGVKIKKITVLFSFYDANNMSNILQADTVTTARLQVDSNATVTGNLNVGGLATIQQLGVIGDMTVQGNLMVYGIIRIATLSVGGHIITGNNTGWTTATQAEVEPAAGSLATCTVTGNDTSGKVTVVSNGTGQVAGAQCNIVFAQPYSAVPNTVLSPASDTVDVAPVYVTTTSTGFAISFHQASVAGQTYQFNYLNVQ